MSAKGSKRRLNVSGEPLPSQPAACSFPTRPTGARRQGRKRPPTGTHTCQSSNPRRQVRREPYTSLRDKERQKTADGARPLARAHVTPISWEGAARVPGTTGTQLRPPSCSSAPCGPPAEQEDQPTSQRTGFPRWLAAVEGDGARRKNVPRAQRSSSHGEHRGVSTEQRVLARGEENARRVTIALAFALGNSHADARNRNARAENPAQFRLTNPQLCEAVSQRVRSLEVIRKVPSGKEACSYQALRRGGLCTGKKKEWGGPAAGVRQPCKSPEPSSDGSRGLHWLKTRWVKLRICESAVPFFGLIAAPW